MALRRLRRVWTVEVASLAIVSCGTRGGSGQGPAAGDLPRDRLGPRYLPLVATGSVATATPSPAPTQRAPTATPPVPSLTPVPSTAPESALETFERPVQEWRVERHIVGGAGIAQMAQGVGDTAAAQLTTGSAQAQAYLALPLSESAAAHTWEERPGTWYWQRAAVYVPAATVAHIGASQYITLAGIWPGSGGPFGWFLRVRAGGALSVFGYTGDGQPTEFAVNGILVQDRWVDLELGLHTQGGPGVKRAFAFVLDGDVYGWYRQGHMADEVFDRAGIGLIDTTSAALLEVRVDQWYRPTTARLPGGPDARTTAAVQEQDFRSRQGAGVQYDWSTWANAPVLHPAFGLSSATNRLQAGRNLDRMPDISEGWAEIEIDWPNGRPDTAPNGYFGPMVGFRKEINREENLEIIPIGEGSGAVSLVLEAWVGNPVKLASWPLPLASIGGTHIPEAGDIMRVRWMRHSAIALDVRASYYDHSAATWYPDIIQGVFNVSHVDDADGSTDAVNFMDGFHTTSSITIDSTQYSIRRYKVGTLDTAP